MTEKKTGETVYATFLKWHEDEFVYHQYVENCTRSKTEPESLNDPPLSILLSVRVM